jgi:toxin-antitoxin system PIN domain toxin
MGFLLDSSVWVALAFDAHPAHRRAMEVFVIASDTRPACFCRSTEQSFLRLASTPAILRAYGMSDMTNDDALRTLDGFMRHPAVAYRDEPQGISSLWPRMAKRTTASPRVWMDAYLAAFAITARLTMVTSDNDFTAFKTRGLDLMLIPTR